jgi:hypothetical protein
MVRLYKFPLGRGLINFSRKKKPWRWRLTHLARLFELQRYYSWIVDRFHLSTRISSHGRGKDSTSAGWKTACGPQLPAHLLHAHARILRAARALRLKVSGKPDSTTTFRSSSANRNCSTASSPNPPARAPARSVRQRVPAARGTRRRLARSHRRPLDEVSHGNRAAPVPSKSVWTSSRRFPGSPSSARGHPRFSDSLRYDNTVIAGSSCCRSPRSRRLLVWRRKRAPVWEAGSARCCGGFVPLLVLRDVGRLRKLAELYDKIESYKSQYHQAPAKSGAFSMARADGLPQPTSGA